MPTKQQMWHVFFFEIPNKNFVLKCDTCWLSPQEENLPYQSSLAKRLPFPNGSIFNEGSDKSIIHAESVPTRETFLVLKFSSRFLNIWKHSTRPRKCHFLGSDGIWYYNFSCVIRANRKGCHSQMVLLAHNARDREIKDVQSLTIAVGNIITVIFSITLTINL